MLRTEDQVKKQNVYTKYILKTVMPHGRHIYAKSYDMVKATMCSYHQSDHELT